MTFYVLLCCLFNILTLSDRYGLVMHVYNLSYPHLSQLGNSASEQIRLVEDVHDGRLP